MGIYIKDTKMPKNGCQDCIFVKRSWKGDICPFLKREVSGNVERGGFQTDCPLIEIPKHGDLIDRDPFIEFIKTHWDSYDQWFVEQLEARPTIIPAKDGE